MWMKFGLIMLLAFTPFFFFLIPTEFVILGQNLQFYEVKFIYSEKATNVCEISTKDLSYLVTVKSTEEISQNFVAISDYMNFITYV